MRPARQSFLSFHRAAEAAGYPALLIVSAACLALVVAPVALLGATQSGWALALALLSLIVALAALAGAVDAALSDGDEPAATRAGGSAAALDERDLIARLARRKPQPDTPDTTAGRSCPARTRSSTASSSASAPLAHRSRMLRRRGSVS